MVGLGLATATLAHSLTISPGEPRRHWSTGKPQTYVSGTWLAEGRPSGLTKPHTSGLPSRLGPGEVRLWCNLEREAHSLTQSHAHALALAHTHSLMPLHFLQLNKVVTVELPRSLQPVVA